jgi:hypothetical protein
MKPLRLIQLRTICYHGKMNLLPYFMGMIRRVVAAKATIRFGLADRSLTDRKQMAIHLRREVLRLMNESASAQTVAK